MSFLIPHSAAKNHGARQQNIIRVNHESITSRVFYLQHEAWFMLELLEDQMFAVVTDHMIDSSDLSESLTRPSALIST